MAGHPHGINRERYVLAVGDAGASRLLLLDQVYGPGTRQLLSDAGLRSGMRAADVGCGIGTVTNWMAEQVGSAGEVIGLDVSVDQLAIARASVRPANGAVPMFLNANVYDTKLPRASFDLIYSRFLLCHLARPLDALREMQALLRPGGILVIQDLDFSSLFSTPPNPAYQRFVELGLALAATRGVDFCFGLKLAGAFLALGFEALQMRLDQPCFLSGEGKRLWERTFLESATAMISAGLVQQDEVDQLAAEFASVAEDESVLVGQCRMPGVWAIQKT